MISRSPTVQWYRVYTNFRRTLFPWLSIRLNERVKKGHLGEHEIDARLSVVERLSQKPLSDRFSNAQCGRVLCRAALGNRAVEI